MPAASTAVERMSPAWLDPRALAEVVRAATGRPDAEVTRWWTEPVPYAVGSWTTAELSRVRGVSGSLPWSAFVKVLRSPRAMPLPELPTPALREQLLAMAAADRTWRHEPDVYRAELDDVLPAGMRLPVRYRIDEVGDDRIVEWLEDVPTADVRWDLDRFARAATLLGRLAVRLTRCGRLPDSVLRVPGEVLRLQFLERRLFVLPALADDAVWAHALVAPVVDEELRADLARLAERVPAILDVLDRLPQTFGHGDAGPQNLLVPADDPSTFVAIDWSLIGPAAVGYDLGQLLIGLAHAGQLDVDDLPAVHDTLLPAYVAGLADEGLRVDTDVVRFGFDAALVVRSAFTALPLAQLAGPPTAATAAAVARRVRLTRHLVDLGLALPEGGP